MRAVIYTRSAGTGYRMQLAACRQLAAERGWNVIAEHHDESSSRWLARTGLDQVREMMRSGKCDVILVHELATISRKPSDLMRIIDEAGQRNIVLAFADGTPDSSSATGTVAIQLAAVMATAKNSRKAARACLRAVR